MWKFSLHFRATLTKETTLNQDIYCSTILYRQFTYIPQDGKGQIIHALKKGSFAVQPLSECTNTHLQGKKVQMYKFMCWDHLLGCYTRTLHGMLEWIKSEQCNLVSGKDSEDQQHKYNFTDLYSPISRNSYLHKEAQTGRL